MSYIPNTSADQQDMLHSIGLTSIDQLFAPIPGHLQLSGPLAIPSSFDQISLTKHYRSLAKMNADADSYPCFLGGGVYDHYVPPTVAAILSRGEFLTSYTPYQPEVSQGTLQSIYEFQTLIAELFSMDLANASMYDAATGLAEAAAMASDLTGRTRILAADTINPAYLEVLKTYLRHGPYELTLVHSNDGAIDPEVAASYLTSDTAALLVQHPNFYGNLEDVHSLADITHSQGALFVSCVDPVSLGLIEPPGAYGADIAVGEGQSLGCPMGYGGPMLGLFTCKKEYVLRLPGRIIGATTDIEGKKAYVMTFRAREQDIRREKATSNICTNVALYALAAAVHLATLGKTGVQEIAKLCFDKSHYLAKEIGGVPGFSLAFPRSFFFKEFAVRCPVDPEVLNERLWDAGVIGGLRLSSTTMLLAVTEQRTRQELDLLVSTFAASSV